MRNCHEQRRFEPSMVIHLLMFLSSVLGSGIAIAAQIISEDGWFAAVIFGCMAIIGPVANWGLSRSAVEVNGSHVVYVRPFSASQAELARIQRVWLANGYLIVDEGKIPRMTIPIYMAGIFRLYALLAQQARRNHSQTENGS
jgi:hypothetical protein